MSAESSWTPTLLRSAQDLILLVMGFVAARTPWWWWIVMIAGSVTVGRIDRARIAMLTDAARAKERAWWESRF